MSYWLLEIASIFAVAVHAMRRVLMDRTRARQTARRGGQQPVVPLDEAVIGDSEKDQRILAFHSALVKLAALNPRQCQVFKLRYFSGLTDDEVASALGITRRTVCRDWALARAWLYSEIVDGKA